MSLVKTSAQILYAARALCNDVDPERLATPVQMATVLLKQSVTEFLEEVGWNGDARTPLVFAVGQWQSATLTDMHPITYGSAQWNGEDLDWMSWDEMHGLVQRDQANTGAVAPGTPQYWNYYQPAANTSAVIQVYPAPIKAGTLTYHLTAQSDNEDKASTQLLLTKPSQQALELLLAKKMVSRMSPQTMERLELGPNTLAALEAEYRKRADEAIWRGYGQGNRQNRVVISRRRGR